MNAATAAAAAWLLCITFGIPSGRAAAVERAALRVGAIKVDITPDDPTGLASVYQTRFTGVHDRTYARGIVLESGGTAAAIVSFDAVEVSGGTAMVARISRETGIPAANIILTATHDHTAPMIGLQNADGSSQAGPGAAAFVAKVEKDLIAALKRARANEQPARVGVARGRVDVNVNRDLLSPTGAFILGRNPAGPSDKTMWIVRFESLTGDPIAILMNYAVHATVLQARTSMLSGELSGAASRRVEEHYAGKVVAIWTIGAAGDQSPVVGAPAPAEPNAERNFAVAEVLGQILGSEAIRVADSIQRSDAEIRLAASEKSVNCPGQKVEGSASAGTRTIIDAAPVTVRLGVLMIDRIAIASVSAEVVTNIYQRLREESPFANTIMITLANGRIGYVPQDISYDNPTFEVYASPLRKGCGESSVVSRK
jgi:hypothetical protein